MSVNIRGVLYREEFVLEERTIRDLVDILIDHGWTYNVEVEDGYKQRAETWTFEAVSDDRQDEQKLQHVISDIVAAGGGAISFSRTLPDGQTTATTFDVRAPSEGADFWRISIKDRARLFSGKENRSSQRVLIDTFEDLADHVSPYVGNLGPEPAVYYGFDGDFDAPPPYFTGVTYLSYGIRCLPVRELKDERVAHRLVELSDGVMFEACETDPPWSCESNEVEELETFLGLDFYPG